MAASLHRDRLSGSLNQPDDQREQFILETLVFRSAIANTKMKITVERIKNLNEQSDKAIKHINQYQSLLNRKWSKFFDNL